MPHFTEGDGFHLSAAVGWLELGNHIEANEELDQITASLRGHPDVLEVRWAIYAKAGKWEASVDIARSVLAQNPDRLSAWIHCADGLRRAPKGGVQAAFDALVPAAGKFPFQSIVPYNLACYSAQLGKIDDAELWFKKAMKLAEGDFKGGEFKLRALEEPDLEPLWRAKGKGEFFTK